MPRGSTPRCTGRSPRRSTTFPAHRAQADLPRSRGGQADASPGTKMTRFGGMALDERTSSRNPVRVDTSRLGRPLRGPGRRRGLPAGSRAAAFACVRRVHRRSCAARAPCARQEPPSSAERQFGSLFAPEFFAVAPKRLGNGESISLSGRVLARPVPSAGKTIVIQARARGVSAWTNGEHDPIRLLGRFAFAYRFRRTFRQTVYEFRALAPRQRSYPFSRGWSRVRTAVVSP